MTSVRDDCQLIQILHSNRRLTAPFLGPNFCRPMEQTFPSPLLKGVSERVDCLAALLDGSYALQLSIVVAASICTEPQKLDN